LIITLTKPNHSVIVFQSDDIPFVFGGVICQHSFDYASGRAQAQRRRFGSDGRQTNHPLIGEKLDELADWGAAR
jgi:hypothetical protein